jgi:ribosome modulation factor
VPLALASALRFFFDGVGWSSFKAISFILSSSFAFLQSLPQSILAVRPRPVSSSLGLSFPSALAGIEGPLVVSLPHSLSSAFRVWLPSWRLAPFDAWAVLFRTAGALGIHPSEPHLPSDRSNVSIRPYPHAVSPAVLLGATAKSARQAAVSGLLSPAEVPFSQRGFSTFAAGHSLGFCPFQGFQRRPGPGFRPNSSHALFPTGSG